MPVKPPGSEAQSPRPTLREERAALTRSRISAAARHLFFRDGYAATTLKAVAREAEVAVQTIYAVFGSKSAILAELRWVVVTQPEADVARLEAMQARTADERLERFAHSIRCRWELAGDIVQIDQDAARVDASLKEQVRQAEARRQAGIAAFARALADVLVTGIDEARAAAAIAALTMYNVYRQLVHVHSWTPDEYEDWLRSQLAAVVE